MMSSIESSIPVDEQLVTDPKTIQTLSNTFVSIYDKDFNLLNLHLEELSIKQNRLINDMQKEREVFDEKNLQPIQEMMNEVKIYKGKIHSIRKQMMNIHQRVKVLKKKSQDIEKFKTDEYNQRNQKRLQEEALIAKTST